MEHNAFELQDELREFYVREERKRELRRRIVIAAIWLLAGSGIFSICWQAFKVHP